MKKFIMGFILSALFFSGVAYATSQWTITDTLKGAPGTTITYQKIYDQGTNTVCYSMFSAVQVIPQQVAISCVMIR